MPWWQELIRLGQDPRRLQEFQEALAVFQSTLDRFNVFRHPTKWQIVSTSGANLEIGTPIPFMSVGISHFGMELREDNNPQHYRLSGGGTGGTYGVAGVFRHADNVPVGRPPPLQFRPSPLTDSFSLASFPSTGLGRLFRGPHAGTNPTFDDLCGGARLFAFNVGGLGQGGTLGLVLLGIPGGILHVAPFDPLAMLNALVPFTAAVGFFVGFNICFVPQQGFAVYSLSLS